MTINSMATSQLQTSMMRLSTMRRINSAADDAAGLAISNAMEAQVRGLDMGTRNTLDMQSLVTTAEGGLSTIGDALLRMRELSIQASNGIMTQEQRTMIQNEVSQLADHINSAARNTQWNGMNLLDGSFTNRHTASDAMGRGATVNIPDMSTFALGLQNFDVTRLGRGGDGSIPIETSAARTQALGDILQRDTQELADRQAELTTARNTFSVETRDFVQAETLYNRARADYNTSMGRLNDAMLDAGITDLQQLVNVVTNAGSVADSRLSEANFSAIRSALQDYNRAAIELGSDTLGLADIDPVHNDALAEFGLGTGAGLQERITSADVSQPGDLQGQRQTFADARQTFAQAQVAFDSAVAARDMAQANVTRTQSMLSSSAADARAAISGSDLSVIDNALAQVNAARSALGSLSNRFDHTVVSNNIAMLNQAAARSRVVDLDVARETSNLRRLQIMQQYQIFAQRNQQQTAATMMLSLLG
jgi:flagellin